MADGYGTLVDFFVGSTTTVEIDALHLHEDEDDDGEPSTYENTATVILESLTDTASVAVTGSGVPITMTYVSTPTATNGRYSGNIPATATLVIGTEYRGIVKATAASGEIARIGIQGTAKRLGDCE